MNCELGLDDEPAARPDIDDKSVRYRARSIRGANDRLRKVDRIRPKNKFRVPLDNGLELQLRAEWSGYELRLSLNDPDCYPT
jgi:hypothetical protein